MGGTGSRPAVGHFNGVCNALAWLLPPTCRCMVAVLCSPLFFPCVTSSPERHALVTPSRTGSVEYKLRLIDPQPARFQQLVGPAR